MKKAIAWLKARDIDFVFHDYKKQGVNEAVLRQAVAAHGWDNVINRRGTTWRKLKDNIKAGMDDERAIAVMTDHSSVIKRPLLVHNGKTYLGFTFKSYENIFV